MGSVLFINIRHDSLSVIHSANLRYFIVIFMKNLFLIEIRITKDFIIQNLQNDYKL